MCWDMILEGFWNIPGFRICQVSAYASIAQGSQYS